MHRLLIVWCMAIASFANFAGAKKQIPDYVPICKRSDPNLSECYRNSFNIVISHLAPGIPDMNLRQIDPVKVDKISLGFGNGTSVSFDARLDDVELFGFSNGKLDKAHIDLDTLKFLLQLSVDNAYMISNFSAKGKILLFQFDSNGSFRANLTNLNASGIWEAERIVKNGRVHGNFTRSDVDVSIGHIQMWFDGLFPTEELNTRVNQAINENIDILYEELKPLIVDVVKAIVIDSVNNVYSLYPLDVLFPE